MSTSNDNLYRWVKFKENKPPLNSKQVVRNGGYVGYGVYDIDEKYGDHITWHGKDNSGCLLEFIPNIEWLEKIEADQQEAERVVTEILTKSWTAKFVLSKLQEKFHIIPKQ